MLYFLVIFSSLPHAVASSSVAQLTFAKMGGARRCMRIPPTFRFILPVQSIVTGVVVYSTVYIYLVGSVPFILAIVAVRESLVSDILTHMPASLLLIMPPVGVDVC